MYYEEKFFDDNWWFRNDPDEIWYKFTYKQLLHKCKTLEHNLKLEREHNEMFKSINPHTSRL